MIPPNEKPTRLTAAGGETTSSSPDDTMSASASAVSTPGGSPESPKPGRAGTHTGKWRGGREEVWGPGSPQAPPPRRPTDRGAPPPQNPHQHFGGPAPSFG